MDYVAHHLRICSGLNVFRRKVNEGEAAEREEEEEKEERMRRRGRR